MQNEPDVHLKSWEPRGNLVERNDDSVVVGIEVDGRVAVNCFGGVEGVDVREDVRGDEVGVFEGCAEDAPGCVEARVDWLVREVEHVGIRKVGPVGGVVWGAVIGVRHDADVVE